MKTDYIRRILFQEFANKIEILYFQDGLHNSSADNDSPDLSVARKMAKETTDEGVLCVCIKSQLVNWNESKNCINMM